jgi:tetratricopeptide (TPR) repeat protein
MAKRKRKSKGGGAFGRANVQRVPHAPILKESPVREVREIDRSRMNHRSERFFFVTDAISADSDYPPGTTKAIYDEKFGGASFEEIFAKYDLAPDPHFLALEHLASLEEGASPEMVAKVTAEALLIDPDCADAHLVVADTLVSEEACCAELEKAVEAGRRKNEALRESYIEDLDPAGDLRGNAFLPALHRLAEMRIISQRIDEAIALLEESLAFDPGDPLYIRPTLLAALLEKDDFDRAEIVLAEMESEERSCATLYGRAFLRFRQAVLANEGFMPDMEAAKPFGKLRSPLFDEASALLREAIMTSPWAVPMLLDLRTALMSPLEFFHLGEPFESLDFARLFSAQCILWDLPAAWILTEFTENFDAWQVPRTLRSSHETFCEMLEYFDACDWGGFEGMDGETQSMEFRKISQRIRETMLAAGAPKKRGILKRRRPR